MVCDVCNKESSNRRVCPYCFTPYAVEAAGGRASTGASRTTGPGMPAVEPPAQRILRAIEPARAFVMRQTPTVRWSGLGILVVLLVWAVTGGEEPPAQVSVAVPSTLAATPMQREEALAIIRQTRETALVEMQADEVWVSYPAANFPVEPEGQVMLAMQFARADEIVEGRKRRILFHNPNGRLFAQSDGITGLTAVR